MTDQSSAQKDRDLARRPAGFMLAWGFPIIVLVAANVLQARIGDAATIVVVSASLAWMGVGCVINAIRCGRLHCLLSGPILLISAALTFLLGFGLISLGPINLSHVGLATIILVFLTFVIEWVAGKYVTRPRNG